jgi:hypothetical protein
MKIYEFQVVEGYEWVLPVNQGDFEVFRGFDGLPRSQSWRPIAVRLIKKSDDRLLAASDVPWLGKHAPVLRRKALEAMSDLLRADGEVLPLACPEADLNVFNATRVLDALDEERSSLVKFPSSGRTMTIKEHAFRPAALDGANLFKIPQMLRGSVIVTDQVVKRVEGARLRGVAFRKVWEG